MSNKKPSSIEWVEQQFQIIIEKGNSDVENLIWQQAKAMHKEEIKDAYNESFRLRDKPYSTAVKYYNETFGGKNE